MKTVSLFGRIEMKATVRDMVNLAGVSPAAVSSAQQQTCQGGNQKKIEAAIEKLDYYPNVLAQNFINNISYHSGVTITEREGLTAVVISSIQSCCRGILKIAKIRKL